jgi:predicted ATPase/DNA-binding CsgD family transcriptional regulator
VGGRWEVIGALTNLAPPSASLVGRAQELAAIRQRLLEPDGRLLTLSGTAGTGKTRLAVATGIQLVDAFVDGVWFVDLVPVSDVPGVLPAIARTLGLRGAELDLSTDESLRLYLADKHALLVIDNCEHVLGAAPRLAELLDACPRLTILATSREPLRVRRERVHPISPLPTPPRDGSADLEALRRVPAVELFIQRATEVHPEFGLTTQNALALAELCRRLDGLPLALELAAARTRTLPPAAILARLESRFDLLRGGRRDDPQRHQTLRAALAWSHELLTDAEKTIFRRLAVFAGGCSLESAEAVCDPARELDAPVLDLLEALLDKSLLKQEESAGEPRFSMLDSIRAFALAELDASGEADAIRMQLGEHLADLVALAAVELEGPRQLGWLARLDREIPNIRASLQFLAAQASGGDHHATDVGLRLGGDLWWWMHARGTYAETRDLVLPLVQGSAEFPPSVARGRAIAGISVAAWGLGDFSTALREAEQSFRIAEAVGDEPGACQALINVACEGVSMGDFVSGREAATDALQRAQALGNEWKIAWSLTFLGMLDLAQGDPDASAMNFDAALRLRQRIGDLFGEAWASNGLASVAMLRGDAAQAQQRFEHALDIFRQLGERPTMATILDALGQVALGRGELSLARQRFEETLVLYREMDSRRGIGIALHGLARVAAADGNSSLAVRLAGAASAAHAAGGSAIELIRTTGPMEEWLERAREQLGREAAEAAWEAGRATPVEQAVAEALAAQPVPRRSTTDRSAGMPLTAREREVARLVAQGASNRQIAEALVIGERTAEAHVSNMLAKLGLSTRVQLATWAVARGLGAEATVAAR